MYRNQKYSLKNILHTTFWLSLPVVGYLSTPTKNQKEWPQPSIQKMFITSCHDGDTCRGDDEQNNSLSLRLAGIDAPELGQEPKNIATQAKNRIQSLSQNKWCQVQVLGLDAYKRHLALIWCDGVMINEQLVLEGLAYAYVNWNHRHEAFAWAERAERMARKNRKGIFSKKYALSPHEYRKRKRRKN
jgi:micrococcal nuclease